MPLVSITVFANTYSPDYETPTINGYNYSFRSDVWDRYNPNGGVVIRFSIVSFELMHWKRCDIWLKHLMILVNAILWFNPLIYMFRCDID